jgi:two-component system nitrogen regulation sensor histidine kinase NtrY
VIIEDNGKGLPQHGREQLTEPYVTTRTKGTGLGLAIVKKIMEDHHGELVLEDGETEGARVSLHFATPETRAARRPDAADEPMELSPVSHGA